MQPVYARIVIMDGIRVPCTGVSFHWGPGGIIEFSVRLAPGFLAERFLPSTHVHVFGAETGKMTTRRFTWLADAKQLDLHPLGVKYLANDFLQDAARHTIKGTFDPLDFSSEAPEGADLLKAMQHCGFHYLGGGILDHIESVGSPGSAQVCTAVCRGYDVDMDLTQLIQLVGGRGTLTALERRFFGQDTAREGKAGTLNHGRRPVSLSDALVKVLRHKNGFSAGVRNLLTQYPALLNEMWEHRYSWSRLGQQIALIEGDTTVERLIGTKSFFNYMRAQLRTAYVLPLREAITRVLDFVGYKLHCVPAPAYWPIAPRPEARSTTVEDVEERTVKQGAVALIKWGAITLYDPASLPLGAPGGAVFDGGQWVYRSGNVSATLDNIRFGAGQTYGKISNNGRQIDFRLPQTNERGQLVYGGGASLTISTEGPAFGLFLPGVTSFVPGRTYNVSGTMGLARGAGYGADFKPYQRLNFTVTILSGKDVVRRKVTSREIPLPTKYPARYHSNSLARLNTYWIGPKLWWATPPVCNVVVPEMVVDGVQALFAGLGRVTRTIGKTGVGRVRNKAYLDKFAAPHVEDLNAAVEDVFDDPIDSVHLQRLEYMAGVRAEVLQFGNLTRLVNQRAWEPYLRSFVTQSHWDRRLEGDQIAVTIKPSVGIVPGTTLLFLRGQTPQRAADLSAEQTAQLALLRALRQMRAKLAKARNAILAHLRRARSIQRWVQNLRNLSVKLYDKNLAAHIPAEEASNNGLWERRGDNLTNVLVGASFDKALSAQGAQSRGDAGIQGAGGAYAQDLTLDDYSDSVGDLGTVEYRASFEALLGPRGIDIWPSVQDRVARLPQKAELDEHDASLKRRVVSARACAEALGHDISLIDARIQEVLRSVRASGAQRGEANAVIGYVQSVRCISDVSSRQETWVLQLSHVRRVGEDLDWDGVAGDDVENTIVFGEDGYLDERYSTARIGKEVYMPLFGAGAITDIPQMQEDYKNYLSEPVEGAQGSLQELTAQFRHPSVCGRSYFGEVEEDLRRPQPPVTYAAQWLAERYWSLAALGDASLIFDWIETLLTRPWMTLPDAYRGFPLGFDPDHEANPSMPATDYEPWASDAQVYGFGLPEFLRRSALELDGGEVLQNANNPVEGFFARSILAPFLSQTGVGVTGAEAQRLSKQDDAGESLPQDGTQEHSRAAEARDRLHFGANLSDNEAELLLQRQRRILAYLETLSDRTAGRSQ